MKFLRLITEGAGDLGFELGLSELMDGLSIYYLSFESDSWVETWGE
jgi:hypothetical protein